jgi:hypothetical protein
MTGHDLFAGTARSRRSSGSFTSAGRASRIRRASGSLPKDQVAKCSTKMRPNSAGCTPNGRARNACSSAGLIVLWHRSERDCQFAGSQKRLIAPVRHDMVRRARRIGHAIRLKVRRACRDDIESMRNTVRATCRTVVDGNHEGRRSFLRGACQKRTTVPCPGWTARPSAILK